MVDAGIVFRGDWLGIRGPPADGRCRESSLVCKRSAERRGHFGVQNNRLSATVTAHRNCSPPLASCAGEELPGKHQHLQGVMACCCCCTTTPGLPAACAACPAGVAAAAAAAADDDDAPAPASAARPLHRGRQGGPGAAVPRPSQLLLSWLPNGTVIGAAAWFRPRQPAGPCCTGCSSRPPARAPARRRPPAQRRGAGASAEQQSRHHIHPQRLDS